MKTLVAIAVALGIVATLAFTDADFSLLQDRVALLEARVAALEGSSPTSPPPATSPPPTSPEPSPTTSPPPTSPPATTAPPPTSPPPSGGWTPPDCTGYPEPRIWYETQSWWQPVPNADGSAWTPPEQGHIHMGLCWPHEQVVSGTVTLDVVAQFHNNAGSLTKFKVQDDQSTDFNFTTNQWVSSLGDEQFVSKRLTIDTTQMPDGVRQWRIYVYLTQTDGSQQRTKAMYRVRVDNVPGTEEETGPKYSGYGATGWYVEADGTDWGYQTATIDPADHPSEGECFSGTWNVGVDLDQSGTSGYMVLIDPGIHNGNLGTVVKQGVQYDGPVSIDTTELTNGWHRLMVESHRTVEAKSNAGVFVLPFRVCN